MTANTARRIAEPIIALVVTAVLALAATLYLTGCASGSESPQSSTSAAMSASTSAGGTQTKDVPVYFEADADPQQVSLTFFDDMPTVPYMRIDDFYQTFMHGKMDVSTDGNGVFSLTIEDGTQATIDTGKDTFAADDFTAFVSHPLLKDNGTSALATSLEPFLALESETIDKAASPVKIDFARYGIDLREVDGAPYLPLATVNDLFETNKSFRVAWDGSTIYAYVLDPDNTYRRTEPLADEEAYLANLGKGDERASDMAQFAYDEMCFKIDTFYGLPGSAPLNDAVAADGLDKALTDNDPETRELLLSTDKKQYLWGLNRLLGHDLDDKMHTSFSDFDNLNMMPEDPFAAAVLELEGQYGMEPTPASAAFTEALRGTKNAKPEVFGGDSVFGTYYTEKGDTALFSFQTFKTDGQGWKDYYAGKADLPVETDSYAALLDAVRKADENPPIKNFVIDLTTNSGGEADAVAGICALVCGDSAFHSEDTLTGQRNTVAFKADRNADGKVDAADDEVSFDLRFAVLTCGSSYSSANLLPQLLHERGVAVIGEQSGGGPCGLEYCTTADGWRFTISSNTQVKSDKWENIDGGVPVDAELVKAGEDGTRDYHSLYDLDAMSAAIAAYYGE